MEPSELFPLPPSAHKTFVRIVELPEGLDGYALEGVCRGCDWHSEAIRAFYASAWEDCFVHRRDVHDHDETGWYAATDDF